MGNICCCLCDISKKVDQRSRCKAELFRFLVVAGTILSISSIGPFVASRLSRRPAKIEDFNRSVDAWNGGAVDNFNMASSDDWTYSLSNSCGYDALSSSVALPSNDMPEDLKKESRETATFGSYPRHTYFQNDPPSVYIDARCTLDYEFFHQRVSVGRVQIATLRNASYSDMCEQASQESSPEPGGKSIKSTSARATGAWSLLTQGSAGVNGSGLRGPAPPPPPAPLLDPRRGGGGSRAVSGTRSRGGSSPAVGYVPPPPPPPPPPPTPEELFRSCVSTCTSQGGTPSGTSIGSYGCELEHLPTEVCVRVTRRDGNWTLASGTLPDHPQGAFGPGCFFANSRITDVRFRRSKGQRGGITVPVRVRHERDPYLQFLAITNGSGDFGPHKHLMTGIILLSVGLVVLFMTCGSGYVYGNKVCSGARRKAVKHPPAPAPAPDSAPATNGKPDPEGNTAEEQAESGVPIASYPYTIPVEIGPECQDEPCEQLPPEASTAEQQAESGQHVAAHPYTIPVEVDPECQDEPCEQLDSQRNSAGEPGKTGVSGAAYHNTIPVQLDPALHGFSFSAGSSSLPEPAPSGNDIRKPDETHEAQVPKTIFTLI